MKTQQTKYMALIITATSLLAMAPKTPHKGSGQKNPNIPPKVDIIYQSTRIDLPNSGLDEQAINQRLTQMDLITKDELNIQHNKLTDLSQLDYSILGSIEVILIGGNNLLREDQIEEYKKKVYEEYGIYLEDIIER